MKASRWVLGFLGVVLLLAGCGGSSGDSTLAVETVARETVPIPADTFAATTTLAPTMLLPTSTTAVPSTTLAPDSEEALRARVLDYHRTFVEEQLQMPNTDFARTIGYFADPLEGKYAVGDLLAARSTGASVRANTPLVDEIEIRELMVESDSASVIVCDTNNYISVGGGPDNKPNTEDDVVLSDELGSYKFVEDWTLVTNRWMFAGIGDATTFGKPKCAA